jgi:DedD protein
MSWAFWRDRKTEVAAKSRADDAQEAARSDQATELHIRTRRRLIGAAALLLAAVIMLPMVLDPTPRPVPDSVAIDIPSDKTPFTPRLSTPAATSAAGVRPAAPVTEEPTGKAQAAASKEAAAEVPGKVATAPTQDAAVANPAAGGVANAQFALQAAALASEGSARDLVAKLKKAGFSPYTEKVSTQSGDRIRVRIGPFATREDAEQARAKLKTLGINAGVVSG